MMVLRSKRLAMSCKRKSDIYKTFITEICSRLNADGGINTQIAEAAYSHDAFKIFLSNNAAFIAVNSIQDLIYGRLYGYRFKNHR